MNKNLYAIVDLTTVQKLIEKQILIEEFLKGVLSRFPRIQKFIMIHIEISSYQVYYDQFTNLAIKK